MLRDRARATMEMCAQCDGKLHSHVRQLDAISAIFTGRFFGVTEKQWPEEAPPTKLEGQLQSGVCETSIRKLA